MESSTQGSFHYRVAAVVRERGYVLLHRGIHEQTWSLPGGRVGVMEPSVAALARELREELGQEVQIGRLVWVIENFYIDGNDHVHELGLYYTVQLPGLSERLSPEPFSGIETDKQLIYQWTPVEQVRHLPLNPVVLQNHLAGIPDHIVHLVSVEAGLISR